jgi:hypothetical protein
MIKIDKKLTKKTKKESFLNYASASAVLSIKTLPL